MADVFISYSRKDRVRVKAIADAVEAEGLSVWWDPEIVPGATFDEVIDRELDAAKCVIVVWSEDSRLSRWVREEATDALDREKLIPVWIDKVPLPRGFKLVQTEDLVGWAGDRSSEPWQRIMIQANALTGRDALNAQTARESGNLQMPAQNGDVNALVGAVPGVGVHQLSAGSVTFDASNGNQPASGLGLVTIVASILITAMWFYGSNEKNVLLSSTAALAALSFLLFRFADADLSPGLKAMAQRWFMPVDGKVKVRAIEGFNNLFEAVFAQRHWSLKCFWRSAVASTVALLVITLVGDVSFQSGKLLADIFGMTGFTVLIAFLAVMLINVVGDYISLWETRLLLKWSVSRPVLLIPFVIIDAILTPVIFALVVAGFFVAIYLPIEKSGAFSWLPKMSAGGPLAAASLASAYLTSIWLWLALLFAPLARVLVWSRVNGLTFIGRILDAQRRPFTALGYVTAMIILIVGGAAWGVTKAMAML